MKTNKKTPTQPKQSILTLQKEKLIVQGSQGGEEPVQEGCGSPIPAGFQDHTELNAEQPHVTSQFSLFSAGGGTRDILGFPPA